jgi:hypothetical protein
MTAWDDDRPDIRGLQIESNLPPAYDGSNPFQFKWMFRCRGTSPYPRVPLWPRHQGGNSDGRGGTRPCSAVDPA